MNEYEVKQIIEYINDESVSDHYGKWGALNREQRKTIRDLCNSWLIINEHDKKLTKILDILEEELEVVGELEDESFNWYQRLIELRKQNIDEMKQEITRN